MSLQVLLVEDDEDYRALLADYLGSLGHAVLAFPSAEEALGHMTGAGDGAPSLVLTDMRMRQMSGLDLARELRSTRPRLPIILMTEFGERQLAKHALALGCSAYIEKPFRLGALRDTIEKLVASEDR